MKRFHSFFFRVHFLSLLFPREAWNLYYHISWRCHNCHSCKCCCCFYLSACFYLSFIFSLAYMQLEVMVPFAVGTCEMSSAFFRCRARIIYFVNTIFHCRNWFNHLYEDRVSYSPLSYSHKHAPIHLFTYDQWHFHLFPYNGSCAHTLLFTRVSDHLTVRPLSFLLIAMRLLVSFSTNLLLIV